LSEIAPGPLVGVGRVCQIVRKFLFEGSCDISTIDTDLEMIDVARNKIGVKNTWGDGFPATAESSSGPNRPQLCISVICNRNGGLFPLAEHEDA
jgi:hypothetical protein